MTINPSDNMERREEVSGPQASVEGRSSGFHDVTGQHPWYNSWYKSSVNEATYSGINRHELKFKGSSFGSTVYNEYPVASQYPLNNVKQTASGHVIELDDTPGASRILIKHGEGQGIELHPDGSITIVAGQKLNLNVGAECLINVTGDAKLKYEGNLDMQVNGDFNLDVGGDYDVSVSGNYFTSVDESKRTDVQGSAASTIKGNLSETIIGSYSLATLGNISQMSKGATRQMSQGLFEIAGGGRVHMSGAENMDISSPRMNIAGKSLSVLGATGTIGGESIYHYGKNYYGTSALFTEGVTSPTFHGELDGKAKRAGLADKALGANTAGGLGGSGTDGGISPDIPTNTDKSMTAPGASSALMDAYMKFDAKGSRQVIVDPGDWIANQIKQRLITGGITDRELSVTEVRSKLRDEANYNNFEFTQSQINNSSLSPMYANQTPPNVGRVARPNSGAVRGHSIIGKSGSSNPIMRYTPNPATTQRFTPDLKYVIDNTVKVTAGTMLAPGVSVGKYIGAEGDRGSLNHIPDLSVRRQIARNLQPNAEAFRSVNSDNNMFTNYRLRVIEGIYKPGPLEKVTSGSINDLAAQGRVAVYELVDNNGKTANEAIFDLAVFWMNHILYDKLILDYDKYDPSGIINAQIILIMPEMPENYDTTFNQKVQTRYNGGIAAENELVEMTNYQFQQGITSGGSSFGSATGENGRLDISTLTQIAPGHYLRNDAAQAYLAMVKAAADDGISWSITDSYRPYEVQVRLAQEKGLYSQGGLAAYPGTSNHGFGLAVDLGSGANRTGTPENNWLVNNAYKFGFSTISREPWHWEFNPSIAV